ncbi:MAG TPA: tRNA pseudouridine(38-40) synthase TruA [bacterium]|nr:tRNA pseudouridine(38-40) synthase TruA [bacterium]
MRNIRIVVEYDGTDFHGWQYQSHCRSVQGTLQEAVRRITSENVVVEGAGRTDTGVHARGQVANFKINHAIAEGRIALALNAVLPTDVRVISAQEAPDTFHARFSARERRYRYRITPMPAALQRHYCWFYPHVMNWEAMQAACAELIGEKNFKSFCLSETVLPHYQCDVKSAVWLMENDVHVFEIRANRFLHNMVRGIVGTMIMIGRGRLMPGDIATILAKAHRRHAGFNAPPHGLCLEEVIY